ncbi:MAG: hypothetical protein ABFD94_05540 [Armatimonadia bacterium]
MHASSLKAALTRDYGYSVSNARQIVSRAARAGEIERLPLGDSHVYYIDEAELGKALPAILEEHAPKLFRIYRTMSRTGGFVSAYEGAKLRPIAGQALQSGVDASVADTSFSLKCSRILGRVESSEGIDFWIGDRNLFPRVEAALGSLPEYRRRLQLQQALVRDLVRWLEKVNLFAWEGGQFADTDLVPVISAGTVWDGYGFSYIRGVVRNRDGQKIPVFAPIDACTARTYTEDDLQAFVDRVEIVENRIRDPRKKHRIVPICLAGSFTPEAFRRAKAEGFLVLTVGAVWGDRIYQLLSDIGRLSDNPTPDEVEALFGQLAATGQLDQLSQLKGYLFEYVVGGLFAGQAIERRQKAPARPGQKEKFEFDLVVVDQAQRSITVVECKGIAAADEVPLGRHTDPDTVKYFFGRTYPIAQEHYRHYTNDEPAWTVSPLFVTSGKYSEDALAWLQKQEESSGVWKRPIYLDRERLLSELKAKREHAGCRVVKQYFK